MQSKIKKTGILSSPSVNFVYYIDDHSRVTLPKNKLSKNS